MVLQALVPRSQPLTNTKIPAHVWHPSDSRSVLRIDPLSRVEPIRYILRFMSEMLNRRLREIPFTIIPRTVSGM